MTRAGIDSKMLRLAEMVHHGAWHCILIKPSSLGTDANLVIVAMGTLSKMDSSTITPHTTITIVERECCFSAGLH